MLWAFRIISGLVIMTAPYIWTVGQAGLETANKNICELASSLTPLPTCQIHFVYALIWGIGLTAAVAFICFDASKFVRRAATPHGGVVLFCRHHRTAITNSAKSGWSKVEPSHLLILAVALAVIAFVWQARRAAPEDPRLAQLKTQNSGLQDQLKTLKSTPDPKIAELQSQLAALKTSQRQAPQSQSPSSSAAKKYTPYEKEQRLRAVDEIYGVVVSTLTPAYISGRDLTNNLKAEIVQGTVIKNLGDGYKRTEAAFSALALSLQRFAYLTDVVDIANSFDHMPLLVAFDSLTSEIQQLQKTAPDNAQSYIDRNVASIDARNAFIAFERWLEKIKPLLKQKRLEFEGAEVYPTGTATVITNAQPAQSASVLVASRYYSAKNKEEISGRLDAISASINTAGEEILKEAEISINHTPFEDIKDLDPHIERVKKIIRLHEEMKKTIFDQLLDSERDYRVELNTILFPVKDFQLFKPAAEQFRDGLVVWKKMKDGEDRGAVLKLVYGARVNFATARQDFVNWLSTCHELIEKARRALKQ